MQFFKSILYMGAGVGMLVVVIPAWMRAHDLRWVVFTPGGWGALGWLLVAAGALVYTTCAWDFASRGRGTPAFWDPPRSLMSRRWFGRVRNPMYLGIGAMIFGQGVAFGSLALCAYALVVIAAFHLFVVFYEEPHLSRTFGGAYDDYRARVPRWLPRRSGGP
jgi:protein-S-isoprenylcysteine O-methyltransferase Ste14